MKTVKHVSDDEIKESIIERFNYLNLDESFIKRYTTLIKNFVDHRAYYKNQYDYNEAMDIFEANFNNMYNYFLELGYDEETSLALTKNIILFSNRNNYMETVRVFRLLNIEKEAIINLSILFPRKLNTIHARKCFLQEINYNADPLKMASLLQKTTDSQFEKAFSEYGIKVEDLMKKYPLTEENRQVINYLGNLKNNEIYDKFGVTRKQLAEIYPTTKNQLSLLMKIKNMKDEEIENKYGLTRSDLLSKYPLNANTLKALKTVKETTDRTIEKGFGKTKTEVIHLRTLTNEMVKMAFQNIRLINEENLRNENKIKLYKELSKKMTYPFE